MATKITKEKIIDAYIDYVLTEGKVPNSVYSFAKQNKMDEGQFYEFFASFDAIEVALWIEDFNKTLEKVRSQEVWSTYGVREKLLSFFFTYFEILKSHRSIVVHSYKANAKPQGLSVSGPLKQLRVVFNDFATELVGEGLESGELKDRMKLNDRYKDAMWAQYLFLLNFWTNDSSVGFEKTDEAIEKGVNVTFDLIGRNPIDNLIDYGKFLAQNARV
jgi:hypothetical protein